MFEREVKGDQRVMDGHVGEYLRKWMLYVMEVLIFHSHLGCFI